jgi:hypothetical protein
MCENFGMYEFCKSCPQENKACCVAYKKHKKNNAVEFVIDGKKLKFRGTTNERKHGEKQSGNGVKGT